jgi:hypothetical protein
LRKELSSPHVSLESLFLQFTGTAEEKAARADLQDPAEDWARPERSADGPRGYGAQIKSTDYSPME